MITKIVITTAPIFVKCSKDRFHIGISVGGVRDTKVELRKFRVRTLKIHVTNNLLTFANPIFIFQKTTMIYK
jgi:sporulation protein YlmC with PRC-barrel domain